MLVHIYLNKAALQICLEIHLLKQGTTLLIQICIILINRPCITMELNSAAIQRRLGKNLVTLVGVQANSLSSDSFIFTAEPLV
jgi:hypothetical protein